MHHWKYLFKGYKIFPFHASNKFFEKKMNIQSLGTTKISILGLPFGSLGKKCHLDVAPMETHRIYYKEGSGASSQRLWAM
jgi:hypothetical protein